MDVFIDDRSNTIKLIFIGVYRGFCAKNLDSTDGSPRGLKLT